MFLNDKLLVEPRKILIHQAWGIDAPEVQLIQDLGAEDLFNSTLFEPVGLRIFLHKNKQLIFDHKSNFDSVEVFGDNQAAISILEKGVKKNAFRHAQMTVIRNFFDELKKPYFFRWLRRTNPFITMQDYKGREKFDVTQAFVDFVVKELQARVYVNTEYFALKWSKFTTESDLGKEQTGFQLVLIPFQMKQKELETVLDILDTCRRKILVCTPNIRKELLYKWTHKRHHFKIPFIKKYFMFPGNKERIRNFNYLGIIMD